MYPHSDIDVDPSPADRSDDATNAWQLHGELEVDAVIITASGDWDPRVASALIEHGLQVSFTSARDPRALAERVRRLARRGVVFVEYAGGQGAAAIEAVRALGHATCVAFVAAHEITAALAAGADDLLLVPWHGPDLLARVEVARARARDLDLELSPWPMHGPDALAVLDERGTITAWNLAAADLLGHDAREIQGRPFAELLADPEQLSLLLTGAVDALSGVKLRDAAGQVTGCTLHLAHWRSGDRRRIGLRIDPCVDVSDELMRIASFPELSPHPVFELTPAGELTYANPALLELPSEQRGALVEAARGRSGARDVASGDRWFHLDVHPTPEWSSVRVYAEDITDRKRAELSLREAHATLHQKVEERTQELRREVLIRRSAEQAALAASAAKSAFLATMSHELRTPLNAIIGYAEMVQDELGPDAPQSSDLDPVLVSARHLLGLINDILDLSKVEAGQLEIVDEPVDLPGIVAEVLAAVTPAARARGDRLRRELPELLPAIRSDGRVIRQILMNLVGNAVKFTRDGEVTVRAALAEGADPALLIEVEDTGIGIAPEKLRDIFEPFTQADSSTVREYGGTGLGLTISRRLAERLGGELEVRSRVGAGSAFTLRLPITRERAPGEP